MPYRTKFTNPDYRHDPRTEVFCAICQRDLSANQKHRWVHAVDGAMNVLHPADEALYAALPQSERAGDMGCFPVGLSCAKRLGLEWSFESPQLDAIVFKQLAA